MISMIACMSKNRVIGKDNKLPRTNKEDMKHFVDITSGHCVVMWDNTFKSIGKPLSGRRNVVLTKNNYPEVECYDNIEDVMKNCKDFIVIWGQSVYEQFLPFTDYIYLTVLMEEYEGDRHMPFFEDKFEVVKREWKDNLVFVEFKKK